MIEKSLVLQKPVYGTIQSAGLIAGKCMNPSQQTPTVVSFGQDVLDRMVLAVELVKQRLQRATSALESAGIKYAVIGGNAVAAWVAQVDPAAARNTVDVDLLVERGRL